MHLIIKNVISVYLNIFILFFYYVINVIYISFNVYNNAKILTHNILTGKLTFLRMQLCDFSTDKIFMAIKCKNNEAITFATEFSAVCTIHLGVSTVSTIIAGAF